LPADGHGDEAARPRAQQLFVRARRDVGADCIPAVRHGVGPHVGTRRSCLAPALVDQEVADRLLQIRPERALVPIRLRKQAARQHDRFEEPLRQVVGVHRVPHDGRDIRADRLVVPVRKLVDCGRRLGAVARGVGQ